MRFSLKQLKQRVHRGFTLVEMLVIAPIVIIVITGLVAAMVAMVGDALASSTRATSAYDMQDALDRIEQDVRTTINFMGTFNYLTAPQGRDGSTAPFSFSSNGDVILTQQATTTNPYSDTRNLVYYADQPANCLSDPTTNNTLKVRTVYFLRNGSLWRRTLVDAWNKNTPSDSDTVCNDPWQRDTCPAGSTMGAGSTFTCNGADEELLKNVTAFTPTYYTSGSTTTPNPLTATAVGITITTSKSVGGETITQSMTTRAQKRNDVATSTTLPAAPVITQYNKDIEAYDNPVTVSFQWSSNGATSYRIRTSSDGGSSWSDPVLTTNNWVSVNVPYNNMPARVRVIAYNDSGASSEITSSQLFSPRWGKPALINNWVCFDDAEPTYACPAYTITSSGLVLLRGMAKSGTVGQPMFSLPERIAPRAYMVLPTSSNSLLARVDVNASGDVIVNYGASTTNYVSLENVSYLSKNAPGVTWANSTMSTSWNNWTSYAPGTYGTTQWTMDNVGRVYAPAMVTGSTTTPGNNCTNCDYIQIPATHGPDAYMILPSIASGNVYNSLRINPTQTGPAVTAIEAYGMGSTTSWNSINSIFYRNDLDPTWYNLTFANSWVNYGSPYSDASCSVSTDGAVTLRGLIKSGTATSATTVANLPASCPKPAKRSIFLAASIKSAGGDANQVAARIDVLPSGAVMFYHDGNASNRWLSLEGIMYFRY